MSIWKRIGDITDDGIPSRGWMLAVPPDLTCAVRPVDPVLGSGGSWRWQIDRKGVIAAGGEAPRWPLAVAVAGEYLSGLSEKALIPILSGHTTHRVCHTLDFEASALKPGSFPIEVAVADTAEGSTNSPWRTARSWLIRPTEEWLASGVWSPESENVHGISLDTLLREGQPVQEVCVDLVETLPGISRLYTDAVGLDGMWLNRLFAAAGRVCPFVVEPLPPLLDELTLSGGLSGAAEIEMARDAAFRRYPAVHRALPDAMRNAEIIRELLGTAGD